MFQKFFVSFLHLPFSFFLSIFSSLFSSSLNLLFFFFLLLSSLSLFSSSLFPLSIISVSLSSFSSLNYFELTKWSQLRVELALEISAEMWPQTSRKFAQNASVSGRFLLLLLLFFLLSPSLSSASSSSLKCAARPNSIREKVSCSRHVRDFQSDFQWRITMIAFSQRTHFFPPSSYRLVCVCVCARTFGDACACRCSLIHQFFFCSLVQKFIYIFSCLNCVNSKKTFTNQRKGFFLNFDKFFNKKFKWEII